MLGRGARGRAAASERSGSNPRAKREEGGTGGAEPRGPSTPGTGSPGMLCRWARAGSLGWWEQPGGVARRVFTPAPSSRLLLFHGARAERQGAIPCAFPAPHPLTAELRRSQLPYLFIYPSVMSAEDAFEALLAISLAGKGILHILVFYSF